MNIRGRLSSDGEGARFRPGAGPLALVLSLALALPAAADQLGGMLRSIGPSLPLPSNSSNTTRPRPDSNAPGAMGLRAPTPTAPLRRLGSSAVAVVEAATGAPVQPMDYVFAKQKISLGPKGRLTLSYLSGCLTETIQGGVVTVDLGGSEVAGGKRQARTTPGCRAATPVVLAGASEAGATVNRVTPFTGVSWDERAIKGAQPVFKWEQPLGAVTLRIKDLDKPGEPVLWQAPADKTWLAYPAQAARLAPGEPYRVEAVSGEKVLAVALFSIDPALDVADSLANRVVPLAAP